MKAGIGLLLLSVLCAADQSTIDLSTFRNPKKYAYAEASYTIGSHVYKLVNVRPKFATDTTCITALVIDKRKYIIVDLDADSTRHGLIVPASQPIDSALIVLKASHVEAKTFIIFNTGKVVTLPGALVMVDKPGKTVYCVWDNDGDFYLTVLNYRKMRVLVKPVPIPRPQGWFTNGLSYYLKTEGEKGYYMLDMFSRTLSKVGSVEGELEKVPYILDVSSVPLNQCCGEGLLKR